MNYSYEKTCVELYSILINLELLNLFYAYLMKNKKPKRNWGKKISRWLPNLYYVGTLVSLLFILAQAFYAKRSIVESSEWEKAKMTIDNVERFKIESSKSPIANKEVWIFGDRLNPDFSTREGSAAPRTDSLRNVFESLFIDDTKDRKEWLISATDELERMIDVMDAFAYPIIMGYANEIGSYRSVARQYYTYGAYIMPYAFAQYPNIGIHAKLLYRLWRIRYEQILVIEHAIQYPNIVEIRGLDKIKDNLLFFEEDKITLASLKRYNKRLDKEIKKIQKEIEEFRKSSYE